MKGKTSSIAMLFILLLPVMSAFEVVGVVDLTLTLSDAELSTEFAYEWTGSITAITDIPRLGSI